MKKPYVQIMREALEKYGNIGSRELAQKTEFKEWPYSRVRETRGNVLSVRAKRNWARDNPEKRMISQIKSRCKKNNIFFDIGIEDVTIPSHCPVLGIPLDKRDANHHPSLDRFDSSKGYTKENVSVISFRANHLKNDATVEEIEKLYNWVKDQESRRKQA